MIEDNTGVAILLTSSLLDHLNQDFLAQVLIVGLPNLWLFLALGRGLLLSLLFLLLLFKCHLELLLSLLQILLSLIGYGKSTFDAIVEQSIKLDYLSLMFLLQVVSDGGLAALFRADHDQIEPVFVLDSGRHLCLDLLLVLLGELRLYGSLHRVLLLLPGLNALRIFRSTLRFFLRDLRQLVLCFLESALQIV